MKTLSQIAEEAGVTPGAIYKKFAAYGLTVETLRCQKNGKSKLYDADVEQLIRFLISGVSGAFGVSQSAENVANKLEKMRNENDELSSKINDFSEKLKENEAENERLREALRIAEADARAKSEEAQRAAAAAEKAEARMEREETRVDDLLEQVNKLTDALRAAEAIQAAQAQQVLKLTDGSGVVGFFARHFGKKKRTENIQEER